MNLVEFKNVSRSYQLGEVSVTALQDVTLNIPKGAFTALVGPSGSGKTTALNLIGCLDKPSQGEVMVAGQAVSGMNRKQGADFRGEKLGFVFQDFNLLPVLTVFENIEYPLLMIRDMPKHLRRPLVEKVLAAVSMENQADKYPAQLSGGQKQRTAIARALVTDPEVVVADEPTANLDLATSMGIMDIMQKLNQSEGATFLFSTHDQRLLDRMTRLVRLEDGCIADGPAN